MAGGELIVVSEECYRKNIGHVPPRSTLHPPHKLVPWSSGYGRLVDIEENGGSNPPGITDKQFSVFSVQCSV